MRRRHRRARDQPWANRLFDYLVFNASLFVSKAENRCPAPSWSPWHAVTVSPAPRPGAPNRAARSTPSLLAPRPVAVPGKSRLFCARLIAPVWIARQSRRNAAQTRSRILDFISFSRAEVLFPAEEFLP